MLKHDLRAEMARRRADCDPHAGLRLAGHVLNRAVRARTVAGFWPMDGGPGHEIDVRPLLLALHGRGLHVLLPDTPPRGQPLTFRRWWPGASMRAGRFGTRVPEGPEAVPDWILVPLVAFDRRCHRLGYGGGYYDRTLAALPGVPTLGCAHAAQQVDTVPLGPHDRALDAVATECGLIFPKEG